MTDKPTRLPASPMPNSPKISATIKRGVQAQTTEFPGRRGLETKRGVSSA